MRVDTGRVEEIPVLDGRFALTLGTFDGVHLGHQALLEEARAFGRRPDLDGAAAVTFGRHPRSVLQPEAAPARLTSDGERAQLMAVCGIDRLVVLEFDDELSRMSYDRFVIEVLRERLGMHHLVLGHDVHFGRDRAGTLQTVAALAEREGFGLSQVASVRHRDEPISSTRLRQSVREGDLEEASAMLGHPYLVRATVVEGRRLGRSIGWPTANLLPEHPRKLLPAVGVYGGWLRRPGGEWEATVTNVGHAPTVEDTPEPRIESHVLDAEGDFYGQKVELLLARRLRGERKFDGLESLKQAISADAAAWREASVVLSPDVHFSRIGGPLRSGA